MQAWLDEQGFGDNGFRQEAEFAALTLISVPEMRGWGRCDWEPDREPCCWDEIDAYEVLFECYLQGGGAPDFWDNARVIEGMRSFAAFLGRRGVIEAEAAAELERGFEIWIPRALEALDGSPPAGAPTTVRPRIACRWPAPASATRHSSPSRRGPSPCDDGVL